MTIWSRGIAAAGVLIAVLFVLPANGQVPGQGKPFDDREFMTKAASSGMAEVEISKIAQTRATNPECKTYAERLVKDHTKANEELMELAREMGVKLPDRPLPEHQKHIDHFRDYKGEAFDREFATHQVKMHEEAIEKFTRAAKEAREPRLKAFATKTLPTLKEHLEMARKLQSRLPKGR